MGASKAMSLFPLYRQTRRIDVKQLRLSERFPMPGISLTIRRTEEGRYCAMILPESAPDLGGEVHPEPVESETLDDLMSQVGERVQRIFEIGSGTLAKTPPVNYRRSALPIPMQAHSQRMPRMPRMPPTSQPTTRHGGHPTDGRGALGAGQGRLGL